MSPGTHNNLLHSPLFFNPWVLLKPMVEDKWRVNVKEHLDPRDYGLSKNKFRHLKVLDLLDENGVKSLSSLKDDLKLTSLHYLSHIQASHYWYQTQNA